MLNYYEWLQILGLNDTSKIIFRAGIFIEYRREEWQEKYGIKYCA